MDARASAIDAVLVLHGGWRSTDGSAANKDTASSHGLPSGQQKPYGRVVKAFPPDAVASRNLPAKQLPELCFPPPPLPTRATGVTDVATQQHVFAVTRQNGTRLHCVCRTGNALRGAGAHCGRVDEPGSATTLCICVVTSECVRLCLSFICAHVWLVGAPGSSCTT